MTEVSLASLFEVEPYQWGLRGDPFLWRAMNVRVLFSKDINTANDFEKLLYDLFLELTNSRPENDTSIFVERYNSGGMSGGHVSSKFWLKEAFPMLVDRFMQLCVDLKKETK